MKESYSRAFAVVICCFIALSSFAQQNITGVVSDNQGAILGATVAVKGKISVQTNANGQFAIEVVPGDILTISFVGYQPKEIAVTEGMTTLDINLSADMSELGEVVITAMGIKRERKSLGYAYQDIKGETLTGARETNITNSLSGRVAGLQVARSSNGPAGSSKIVLRGFNSLTGDNQPLIVVDGIPMDNFTGASNNDFWNPSEDRGNGLGDINPDDIESMSVLKGGAAAALYGSRAGNGVILITTKTGSKQNGLGITYSSSLGFESIFTNPKFQNEFGQGTGGSFDDQQNLSWGPRIEGQEITNWNDETVSMRAYDNVTNYFNKGFNNIQNISFQQQIQSTSVYSSINFLQNSGIIPGSKLTRANMITRAVSKFGKDDRWTTDFKVQYINSNAQNRPVNGVNTSNAFLTTYLMPRSLDIQEFSAATNELGSMLWYGASNQINPYWNYRYNLNQDVRDRFLLNGSIRYDFNDWLNAEVKVGSDLYTTATEARQFAGSPLSQTGRYSKGKETFVENNYIAMINAKKDNIWRQLGFTASLGGQLMQQTRDNLSSSAGELEVPNLFSINNGKANPTVTDFFSERRINSVFGSLGLNWDGYFFLDGTIRNDWTTTLHPDNRSFLYPSVSSSLIINEMLERSGGSMPSWVSFAKVRASYAEVGNDMQPYQLYNIFTIGKDPLGNTTAGRNTTKFDPFVRSELIKNWEVGADFRLFNNRLGIDAAFYKSNATNQLISLPMDPLSGYQNQIVNAGDIENKGVELMLTGRVLDNPAGFSWDLGVNFSRNINTIKALTDEIERYSLGGFDNVSVNAVAGQLYGQIWGTKFVRVEDANSPYNGELVLTAGGLPQSTQEAHPLGDQQARALLGITNTFTYKDLSLSFLIDGRFGGKIFSNTNRSMQQSGTASITAENGRSNFVVPGVILDVESNTYAPNGVEIRPEQYWTAITTSGGNLGINEANLYDASNIRVRNIQLNYNLPRRWVQNTPIQRARVGFTCNNVWLISSHMNGVDPESVFATATNAVGFEGGSAPTARSFLFNLSVTF
ncbi:SusC/RagA family TonB-linked outer membrane protein [Olivibacter sp. SDN3]|uniref:SusC/RagA family TonB-linked outer membrane protein n=1 Tax=Olivibacter sp. SDN3 TaxID=2764720 RepID=UPI0016515E0B|nr:SusC/RagA family TonB-linked outer membrane protein [Olivibacter sp. SDN3]QNL48413.1 SusC/RagA family TonB-linked outer membrane protein [Olivibacter sp. SDN3]